MLICVAKTHCQVLPIHYLGLSLLLYDHEHICDIVQMLFSIEDEGIPIPVSERTVLSSLAQWLWVCVLLCSTAGSGRVVEPDSRRERCILLEP